VAQKTLAAAEARLAAREKASSNSGFREKQKRL